jgi:1,2-phenylacetyl-CoA epoxidase catalytic subunit
MQSDDAELAGLAAKIDREEVYHRLHAELWAARLRDEPRFTAAVEELWPYALGVVEPELRPDLARRVGLPADAAVHERTAHTPELAELLMEMTEVRRSEPGAQW